MRRKDQKILRFMNAVFSYRITTSGFLWLPPLRTRPPGGPPTLFLPAPAARSPAFLAPGALATPPSGAHGPLAAPLGFAECALLPAAAGGVFPPSLAFAAPAASAALRFRGGGVPRPLSLAVPVL